MKRLLTIIFVLITFIGIAQNKKALKLFDKGVEAFNKKDFKTADSLFGLSAKLEPNRDTYFNIAAVKNELGDRCGFCENIKFSIALGNLDALELLKKNCIQYDTLHYINTKETDTVYFCVREQQFCSKSKNYYINKETYEKGKINHTPIFVDTNKVKVEDFFNINFDVEKFFKDNFPTIVIEEMPTFPGGDFAQINFISENIVYPSAAIKKNIQGVVYTTFIVEEDGTLTEIKILRGIGGGCDEECIRVIKLMPKWNPGKLDGKAVRVQFNLPIKFTVQ